MVTIGDWPTDRALVAHLSSGELMAHPRFGGAVDTLIDGLANLYGDDRRLIRSLFEYRRAVTFMIAVCVAANHRDDRPAEWLAISTLAQAAAQMGIGPARYIRRVVDELREDGMLETRPMPGDARRYWLQPTARMLAIDREWMGVFHRPLLTLYPDAPRYRVGSAGDPDYHHRFRIVGLSTLAMAHAVMLENPAVDFFLHQTSGARLLAVLLQSARDSRDGWTAPGFYSIAARRCAATRVHVRSAMRSAADAGLVEIAEAPELRVRPTAMLQSAFARWTADALSAVDLVSVCCELEADGNAIELPKRLTAGRR